MHNACLLNSLHSSSSPLIEEFSNTFPGLFMPVFMGEFSAGLRPLNEHNERFNLSKDMVNKL